LTKSPASGAGNTGETTLMSQVWRVRNVHVDQCVSAYRVIEVSVFVYLRTSCSQLTEAEGR